MTIVYNIGDLSSWLSALGGIGSIGAAYFIARAQHRQAKQLIEKQEAIDHVYQTEIVQQAADLVENLLAEIEGTGLSFDGAEWHEYSDTARKVNAVSESIHLLSGYSVLSPLQRLRIDALAKACSLPSGSIHGNPSSVTYELRQLVRRLETEKSRLSPLL